MKKLLGLLFAIIPVVAFAQFADIGAEKFLEELLAFAGSLKGASTMVIVVAVVQLVMKALRFPITRKLISKVVEITPAKRLMILYGLTVVAGVTGLMADGLSIGSALLHSNTLAALQVFANQIYKKSVSKKEA